MVNSLTDSKLPLRIRLLVISVNQRCQIIILCCFFILIERGLTFVSADLLDKLSFQLNLSVAQLFCKQNEKIFDENVLRKFDRISEKHLIRALEGIKADIRQSCVDE